jgi:hypothetical protein
METDDVTYNSPIFHYNDLGVLTRCPLYLFGCPSTTLSMTLFSNQLLMSGLSVFAFPSS